MGAAILLRNVVGIAVHALLVGIVPLQCDLDRRRALLRAEPEDRLVHGRARSIQMRHESLQAAVVLKHIGFVLALIDEFDAHAGVQERELAQPLGQRVVVELNVREDLGRGLEADRGAAFDGVAHDCERCGRLAQMIFLAMHVAVARDREQQIIRQRVDDRDAHPVQTARDLVRGVIELTARVQHGHDHFGSGPALLRMDINRNAAAIVRHRDRLVCMDRDDDAIAVARQRLVNRVIDHLENHVVQAGTIIGITDVHSRPFPHCVKTT